MMGASSWIIELNFAKTLVGGELMCVEKPSGMDYARAWISNWQESDDPLALKVWHVARNYAKRVRTLSACCGNDGQVGC